jgi:hypothetical protein
MICLIGILEIPRIVHIYNFRDGGIFVGSLGDTEIELMLESMSDGSAMRGDDNGLIWMASHYIGHSTMDATTYILIAFTFLSDNIFKCDALMHRLIFNFHKKLPFVSAKSFFPQSRICIYGV